MPQSTAALIDRIDALLDEHVSASSLEATLTDGYARVLTLEAERIRLGRDVVRLASSTNDAAATELSSVGRRIGGIDDELSRLRRSLDALKRHGKAA